MADLLRMYENLDTRVTQLEGERGHIAAEAALAISWGYRSLYSSAPEPPSTRTLPLPIGQHQRHGSGGHGLDADAGDYLQG